MPSLEYRTLIQDIAMKISFPDTPINPLALILVCVTPFKTSVGKPKDPMLPLNGTTRVRWLLADAWHAFGKSDKADFQGALNPTPTIHPASPGELRFLSAF